MEAWGRVLNAGQKTFTTLLLGLTLYGGFVLAVGGYGVVQRRKQQKGAEDAVAAVAGKEELEASQLHTAAPWSFLLACCVVCSDLHLSISL